MPIPRFPLSLRWRLVVGIVLPLLVAITLGMTAVIATMEQRAEQRMQEDMELVARAIQLPVGYSLEREREGSVRQALESVFQLDQVYGAYVYNAHGEQLAHVGPGRPQQEPEAIRDIGAEEQETGQYEQMEGRDVYSHYVALTDETTGQIIGWLQVTRRASDFVEYMQVIQRQMIGAVGIGTLVVMALVLFGYHRAVGRHIESLVGTMGRVRRGERDARAGAAGPREVLTLAQALNEMLDSIEQAEKEISERRLTQLDLEERLRHSEKLAAIGRLAAGIAHELGAPLSVVDGRARRVLREGDLSDKQQANLEDIRAEVQRMSHIVRQLLDFGRTSASDRKTLHGGNLARSSVEQVSELSSERGIAIETEGELPGPRLHADPIRIEQALVNLLRNAVQAADSRVRITWTLEGDRVRFDVDDDGDGISEKDRSRLFEPFFTTKSVGEGTGLGLSVVHGIANEHYGEIEVDANDWGGARFTLYLPAGAEGAETADSSAGGSADETEDGQQQPVPGTASAREGVVSKA